MNEEEVEQSDQGYDDYNDGKHSLDSIVLHPDQTGTGIVSSVDFDGRA